jgi:hypothetical protein
VREDRLRIRPSHQRRAHLLGGLLARPVDLTLEDDLRCPQEPTLDTRLHFAYNETGYMSSFFLPQQ